jgi:antitoxin MazE
MMTNIVSIGNSKGIRIPKVLLEQSGLGNVVELHVKRGEVRITSAKKKKIGFNLLSLASENSLAKDWFRPEEEEAWKSYQSDK